LATYEKVTRDYQSDNSGIVLDLTN
jgi:hypothetical protein